MSFAAMPNNLSSIPITYMVDSVEFSDILPQCIRTGSIKSRFPMV